MTSHRRHVVVAIDGPSGSGKSSTSRGVAQRLGYAYLDTGAMYRAIAWAVLDSGVDLADPQAVARVASAAELSIGTNPVDYRVTVNGHDVTMEIRGDSVTAAVSPVAAVPAVRTVLVERQQAAIAEAQDGIVVEGRDIGTVVAPDAPIKIFLVADAAARAERRAKELGLADAASTAQSLAARDKIDSERKASPLVKADDATTVDGTFLSLEQVIEEIVALVEGSAAYGR